MKWMKWSRICHARRADQVSWTHTRSKIAVTKRANPSADLTELRRQLKAERLEDHIKRVVDSAPPLNSEQRARIAALLTGGGDAL
jgi:sarcosine oxidase gamma subunit